MKNKKKVKEAFTKLVVSKEFEQKVLNKTVNKIPRVRRIPQIALIISSVLLIFIVSMTIVYAEEIINLITKGTVTHKYTPYKEWDNSGSFGVSKEADGVHTIYVTGRRELLKKYDYTKARYDSITEVENALGINLLKSDQITYELINVFGDEMGNRTDTEKEPGRIRININSTMDIQCLWDTAAGEDKRKCMDHTRSNRLIAITASFLTQYATEEQAANNKVFFADFPEHPDVEFHNSKKWDSDIVIKNFITKGEDWTDMFEAVFIHDNIIYFLKGYGFETKEVIEIIEAMRY